MPYIVKHVNVEDQYPEMDRVIHCITVQNVKKIYDDLVAAGREMIPWEELPDKLKEHTFSEITDDLVFDEMLIIIVKGAIIKALLNSCSLP